jgi:NADH-quinone oxidoreductase subunit L
MVTHAFFKALLFLGAGSVMHGLHDEQDMKRMGGLRRWMPITAGTFIAAWLAIAGIPPFSGFWSKDEVLANAWDKSPVLWVIGAITALLTAYYMSRQVFLVFFGEERWRRAAHERSPEQAEAEPEHEPPAAAAASPGAHGDFRPHESPGTMALPLIVLAVLSFIGGGLNVPFGGTHFLETWLHPTVEHGLRELHLSTSTKVGLALATAALGLVGLGVAALVFVARRRTDAFQPAVLRRAWGVDALYSAIIERPGRLLSTFSAFVVDLKVIDGAVNGVASLVRAGGARLRAAQSGYVRNYALAVASGAVLLLGYVLARGGT